MADTPISSLDVVVGAIPSGSYFEIATPDPTSGTGFASGRVSDSQIRDLATGNFVPTSRAINTGINSGLDGGGDLTTDLNLVLDVDNLVVKTAMVVGDSFAINNSATNDANKITFPNAMKAIAGLTHKDPPAAADQLIIYSIADSDVRYTTLSEALSGAGSLPAGGTTGQALFKTSATDYDTEWGTLPIIGGGTGAITLTDHGMLVGSGTGAITALAVATDGQLIIGQSAADPAPTTVTGDVTINNLGVTAIGANKVLDTMIRQGAARSVIGVAGNALANVADIVGTTDQILRVDGAGTGLGFGSIDLSKAAAVGTSLLPVANGGTNLASGTSGGILGYTAAGVLASSVELSANQIVLGGGAGATPGPLGSLGTSTQVLHGNAAGAPTWSAVSLTADVSGILPGANGGTGNGFFAVSGPTTSLKTFAFPDASATVLTTNALVSVPQGGTGASSFTAFGVVCGGALATDPLQSVSGLGTANQILTSNGAGALPSWQSATSALGAALTKADDTNVTLTLGGTPTTALLAATSLTLGWTGLLSLARGGTNANLTASAGGLVYSTASELAILAGTATAGQIPRSGSSAAPSWSTATYPASAAAGTVLAAATADTVAGTATPVLGVPGSLQGSLGIAGVTSGTVTIAVQAAAGTYNFNLPTGAGSSGQPLLSGGGGAAMTFGTLGPTVGGTGQTTYAQGDILYASAADTLSKLTAGTSGQFLKTQGAGANPVWDTPAGGGDVVGPASSTDNAAARFDSTTGKLLQNGALLIADTTGAVSRSGGGGIPVQGTNTNDSAAAGYVGEYVESEVLVGAAVAVTSATDTNVTSASLSAGDWDCWGTAIGNGTATIITSQIAWISATSATLPTAPNKGAETSLQTSAGAGTIPSGLFVGQRRYLLAGSQTTYLSYRVAYSGGAGLSVYGIFCARRRR